MRIENLIEGGAQERGKRAGTENLPAIMGMAVALEDAVEKMEENSKKLPMAMVNAEISVVKISI